MPAWQSVQATARPCSSCGQSFSAKRATALYCSALCSSRARPHRPYEATPRTIQRRKAYLELNNAKVRGQAKVRHDALMAFLRAYKLEHGCTDCGYADHHAPLEFDHIADNKELNVCQAKSIRQAKAEIAKCEVVCSNCHRIRTFDRLQSKKVTS